MLRGCGERVSAFSNSLIPGENTGNFGETPLPACTNPLKHETSLGEFPAIGTGNFLLQTGKSIALNSELRMSACWREADIVHTDSHCPLLTHSGYSANPPMVRRSDRKASGRSPSAARLATGTVERKAGSCIGAQELSRHFSLSQFVKGLTRAVQRDDVIDVHLLELSYCLSHVIFMIRR